MTVRMCVGVTMRVQQSGGVRVARRPAMARPGVRKTQQRLNDQANCADEQQNLINHSLFEASTIVWHAKRGFVACRSKYFSRRYNRTDFTRADYTRRKTMFRHGEATYRVHSRGDTLSIYGIGHSQSPATRRDRMHGGSLTSRRHFVRLPHTAHVGQTLCCLGEHKRGTTCCFSACCPGEDRETPVPASRRTALLCPPTGASILIPAASRLPAAGACFPSLTSPDSRCPGPPTPPPPFA